MKNRSAFTIIEVLIALSLSSIIIFGMMQTYNNVIRYLTAIQELQSANRKACLLFNQIERDFSTAFIPPLLEPVKTEKDGEAPAPVGAKDKPKETADAKTPEEQEREDIKKREKFKIYFLAIANDNDLPKRMNEQRCYPFRSVSFINTNPLQVYGERRVRVVRVYYELVRDKVRSKGDKVCYKLYRKETEDLENYKLKEDETESAHDKRKIVRTHLVADGIKDMFLQYVYKAYKKDDKSSQKKEMEERFYDSWGEDKKDTYGFVPCRVNMLISFWNEKLSKNVEMQAMFPIVGFSLHREEEKKKQGVKQEDASKQ